MDNRTTSPLSDLTRQLSTELVPGREPLGPVPGFDVIRTETVLSRFPVHNLSKKGDVDIHILRRNEKGEIEIRWEVSFNKKYGQARQLAYKLDTLVVNRRLEEEGRPLPKLIRLGSLRDIAERLDMGSNTNIIKRALRQNASAFITIRVCYTTLDGHQKTVEADFTRYSVIFTGEKLPDKRRADAVYLNLHDVYWSILNEAPWRPLDYDYLKALNPAAQRFYEILSYRFYNALRFRNLTAAKIAYSEYCSYSAQQRYFDYEHFKKQMYKVHQPHKRSGYLADVRYEPITDSDGRPDWMMWYTPGPKARIEFESFTGQLLQTATPEAPDEKALPPEVPSPSPSPDRDSKVFDSHLVDELVRRGVSARQALSLLRSLPPGQPVLDQLEYADFRIASEPPGTFRNPPGFYVSVLRDNTPVPTSFQTSSSRGQHEAEQLALPMAAIDPADYEEAWLDYKRQAVADHIQQSLTPSAYDALVEAQQREYVAKYKAAALWPHETLRQMARNAVSVQLEQQLKLLTLEEFIQLKHKVS